MPLRIMSWNIKQFSDKAKKPNLQCGPSEIAAMATMIAGATADVVIVLEVTTAKGAVGMTQLLTHLTGPWFAAAPGAVPPWSATATANNDLGKPDRYGVLWRNAALNFRGFTWPDRDNAGTLLDFRQRAPAMFKFDILNTPYHLHIVALHGPEPAQNNGLDSILAMQALAQLAEVTHPPPNTIVVICGDFNVDSSVNAAPYNGFAGYTAHLTGALTSLGTKFDTAAHPGDHRASAYDNIFLPNAIVPSAVGLEDFVVIAGTQWSNPPLPWPYPYPPHNPAHLASWNALLKDCRSRVSDHLPVWVEIP